MLKTFFLIADTNEDLMVNEERDQSQSRCWWLLFVALFDYGRKFAKVKAQQRNSQVCIITSVRYHHKLLRATFLPLSCPSIRKYLLISGN